MLSSEVMAVDQLEMHFGTCELLLY